MRVLEARFHPYKKNGDRAVVIGRVLCDGRRAVVEPARVEPSALNGASGFDLDAALAKLSFLVQTSVPEPFNKLQEIRSDFWSFVEIESERVSQGG